MKFSKLVFSFVIVCLVLQISLPASAFSLYKCQTSPLLSNNVPITNQFGNDYDEELYYQFNVPENGYFRINFVPDSKADSALIRYGWSFTVYDSNGNIIFESPSITSDYSTGLYSFKPDTYYILVTMSGGYWLQGPENIPFSLSYSFTPNALCELEPNNFPYESTEILPNAIYTGSNHLSTDSDYYKITIPAAGDVTLNFSIGETADISTIINGWSVTLFDEANQLYLNKDYITKNISFPTLSLWAGTFIVKVTPTESVDNTEKWQYKISVTYDNSTNSEKEKNDTKKTATPVLDNSVTLGNMFSDSDIDYYKFTVKSNGYSQFDITLPPNFSRVSYAVSLLDKNNLPIRSWTNIENSFTSPPLPLTKGTYYIKISGLASFETYLFRYTRVKSANWENEPNNNESKATSMTINQIMSGINLDTTDKDYYKIVVPTTATYQFVLRSDKSAKKTTKPCWSVALYKKGGSTVIDIRNKETSSKKVRLTKGTYYVVVENPGSINDISYNIMLNNLSKPKTTSITKIKSKNKVVTINWKKAANANKYIIYRSTSKNKGFKKIGIVIGDTGYTDKEAPAGKTCYYRIISANDTFSKTFTSANSKVKSVKVR